MWCQAKPQNPHRRAGTDSLQDDTPQTHTPQTGARQTQTSQTDEAQTYTPNTDAPTYGERHPMVTHEAGHQSSNDQDGEALANNLCVQLKKLICGHFLAQMMLEFIATK